MILQGRSSTALRRVAIIVVAAAVPALAGCEAGNNAPTLHWHQPTAGASAVINTLGPSGQIVISDMFVLGPPPDSSLAAGSSAGLFLALVNTGPADRLTSVSAPGTASSVRLPHNGVGLMQDQEVLLSGPAPQVILDGLTRGLSGGDALRVVLNFQNAGSVTLDVPVMPMAEYYATFSPAPPIPTVTPTPTAKKKSGSATTSPSATPSPTASPSPSATPPSRRSV